MEKRILLSFALSFLVLVLFYQFVYTPPPVSLPVSEPEETAEATAPDIPAGPEAGEGPVSGAEATPPGQTVEAAGVETVDVGTAVYAVRLSNAGAVIESFRLLDYEGAGGETLELLDPEVDRALGWPLALVTGDPEIDAWLGGSNWVIAVAEPDRVRFELAGGGRDAFKELRFSDTAYGIELEAGVRESGLARLFSVVWQGSFGDQSTPYTPASVNLVYQEAGVFERQNVESLPEEPGALESGRSFLSSVLGAVGMATEGSTPLSTAYVGVEDQYFLALFHSEVAGTPRIGRVTAESPTAGPLPVAHVEFPYTGEGLEIYVGPKQRDHLSEADPALASAIDYGFFEILARPLLSVLLWIQGYIGNFGWSIILMTLLINAALFPLRLKQQLSMLKMQKIQPQMRTLQDRYKKLKPNDPRRQEVQSEMMGLYKKHGVNPLGGCLPMLLQMPIFIAIFELLRSAVELRHAPWMLWVGDLSAHDPYYVLPVLMGVSMVISQRMMPTAMDPAQARIMMFMPLLFMVFMVRAQSGLVLYWLTSQLVGVGQQVMINRYWAPGGKKAPPAPEQPSGDDLVAAPPVPAAEPAPAGAQPARGRRRRKK
jgi:YidC/Oxa1 family membrane protein insertase